jgi:hypothetical protein
MNAPCFRFPLRWLLVGVACCALLSVSGCMTQRANISMPGTIDVQRRRAVRLDPYPNQEIAPEIVGGRPREFDEDRSEANRAKLLREMWWGAPF